jgi:murein DD-endopeptidase MepM/ murein hydrolase activator NlpD
MKTLMLAVLFCLPLRNLHLTSGYGYRWHPVTGKYAFHGGIDLRASYDTVFAVLPGFVSTVTYSKTLGIYIRLAHDSISTVYGHLSLPLVAAGDSVEAGQPLAISVCTGRVTAPHLHFAVTYHHQLVNPLKFLYQMLNQKNHE